MKRLFGFLILAASLGDAQVILPFPSPGSGKSTYTELKAALNLTDAQIQQLLQLQTNYIQSNQTLYNQLSEQQRILNQQLISDTPDAVAAGAAVVAIFVVRRQLTTAERNSAIRVDFKERRIRRLGYSKRTTVIFWE